MRGRVSRIDTYPARSLTIVFRPLQTSDTSSRLQSRPNDLRERRKGGGKGGEGSEGTDTGIDGVGGPDRRE